MNPSDLAPFQPNSLLIDIAREAAKSPPVDRRLEYQLMMLSKTPDDLEPELVKVLSGVERTGRMGE